MKEDIRNLLLSAYRLGWFDAMAGDDVRSLDYQTDDEILKRIEQIEEEKSNKD